MKKVFFNLLVILIVGITIYPTFSVTRYVKYNAGGSNNGASWANAYTSFQSALNVANSGDQIWVAKGTYKPSYDYGRGGGSRYYHFRMKEGVAIYGGFAGTESAVSDRTNFGEGGTNETILSGDLNGDDNYGSSPWLNLSDNCYHVFYRTNAMLPQLTSAAKLDGFTILGGNADGSGDDNNGGGIFNTYNAPEFKNIVFKNNNSGNCGGGFYNSYGSKKITNSTFKYNKATNAGAGLFNGETSNVIITNCIFTNDSTGQWGGGGGIKNYGATNAIITNCIFSNNFAHAGGGSQQSYSSPTYNNCLFTNNRANYGGGIYGENGGYTTTINNSIIWGNIAAIVGSQITMSNIVNINNSCYSNYNVVYPKDIVLDYSGSPPPQFNATNCITSNPLFLNASSGDFRIGSLSPCKNTGNNAYNSESYDIRGQSRIQQTTIDMGAYEFTSGIDLSAPVLTSTTAASAITSNAAASGGTITTDGGVNIDHKGVVWSTSSNPTIALSTKTDNGTGTASFISNLTNLSYATTYYVRAYATNSIGTGYGNEISFTTLNMVAPSVGIASISLNVDQNGSNWDDNNSDNSNASVPTNGGSPSGDATDNDFGNHPTWTFDGSNDCFQLPYNNNSGRLNNNSPKSLFVYFRTNLNTSNRQVLLELGGTNSGFNAYIYSGKVWVGIWNSTQRRYFSTSISNGTNYLVSAEFNGTKVRTSLNGYCSSSMLFSGFATNSNTNGIGASINGTRYMDNTSSTGLSSFLNGTVAEILMYNTCDMDLRESIVEFIDTKYSTNYSSNYTAYFGKATAESDWIEYEMDVSPFDNNDNIESKLEVYKSQKDLMINLNLDESENIELAIFDMNGIKVGTISNSELKKGINNFTYSTEGLISGVFLVRAIGLNVNESVKINIIK